MKNKYRLTLLIAMVLLPLLLMVGSAAADPVVGTTTVNSSSTGRTSATFAHTVTAGSNRLLVVSVFSEANESVTGITYAGNDLLQAVRSQTGANPTGVPETENRVEIWYLVAPPQGSANVIVSWASSVDPSAVVAVNFTGVNQTQPIGAVVANTGTSGQPTISIDTFFANSTVFGGVSKRGGDSDPFSPGANITELNDGATGTDNSGDSQDLGYWDGWRMAATAGAYTFNATSATSDEDWAIAAVEIIDAGTNVGAADFLCSYADIILALDYTASLTEADFDNILNAGNVFTSDLDDKTPPGAPANDNSVSPHELGLVTFPLWNAGSNTTTANAGVAVGLQSTESAIVSGIDATDADASGTGGPGGFGTHIGDAVQSARTEFTNNGDPNRVDVLVIITDGQDYDDFTQEEAAEFKNSGGIIYTVAFGLDAGDAPYLESLSSGEDFFYLINSSDLDEVVSAILEAILCSDFGDLPQSYELDGINLNTASHTLNVPLETAICPNLWLGDLTLDAVDEGEPDPDGGAQSGANANGDNVDPLGDDEEGVQLVPGDQWEPGTTPTIRAEIVDDGTGNTPYLVGWFDFSGNGSFEAAEIIVFGSLAGSTSGTEHVLNVPIPNDLGYTTGDPIYTRFRLYNGDPGTPSPFGEVSCGEVEDHLFTFTPTALTLGEVPAARAAALPEALPLTAVLALTGLLWVTLSRGKRKVS